SDIDLVASIDYAIGGNDTITIGSGRSIVVGGIGNDTITGGSGTSVILGDSGAIYAASDNVHPFGSLPITLRLVTTDTPTLGGDDTISTTDGSAVVLGGSGKDTITTGSGETIAFGDNGYVVWTGAEYASILGLPLWSGADLDPTDLDLVASIDTTYGD